MSKALSKWVKAITLKQPTVKEAEQGLQVERLTSVSSGGLHVNWWAGDNIMFRISPMDQYGPATSLVSAYMLFRSDFFKADVNAKPVDLRPVRVCEVSLDTSAGEFARSMQERAFFVKVENVGTAWEVMVERAFGFKFTNRNGVADLESAGFSHIEYYYRAPVSPKRSAITFSA